VPSSRLGLLSESSSVASDDIDQEHLHSGLPGEFLGEEQRRKHLKTINAFKRQQSWGSNHDSFLNMQAHLTTSFNGPEAFKELRRSKTLNDAYKLPSECQSYKSVHDLQLERERALPSKNLNLKAQGRTEAQNMTGQVASLREFVPQLPLRPVTQSAASESPRFKPTACKLPTLQASAVTDLVSHSTTSSLTTKPKQSVGAMPTTQASSALTPHDYSEGASIFLKKPQRSTPTFEVKDLQHGAKRSQSS
jgi:hypothetical protein